MTPLTSAIVVQAGNGGRRLVWTADSVARQGTPAAELIIASGEAPAPLVQSIRTRLGARVVGATQSSSALNAAVGLATADCVAIVPAGFILHRDFTERCASALARSADAYAVVMPVSLQTPDGRHGMTWEPCAIDVAALVANPRGAPPVLFVRRSGWEARGGFDESLDRLAVFEWWLRASLAGGRVVRTPGALVAREADTAATPEAVGTPGPGARAWLQELRTVLERHHEGIAQHMTAVLVAAEVRFGTLRGRHGDLVRLRDAGLAELDRLRAEAAHHRAYLEHHGKAAFDWGDLRRTDPVSRHWGYERGTPLDRRYIDDFIASHSSDVSGAVLEVQEDELARTCGGPRVGAVAVVDIDAANTNATVLADLRCAPQLRDASMDAIVLTQTLHVIDDMESVLRECHRILRPGGVLLATIPAASRVCLEYGTEGDLWRVTPAGARALFARVFASRDVDVTPYGNVLTNVAFLHGLAAHELTDDEYASADPYFPALTGIRARKTTGKRRVASAGRGLVLMYHRVAGLSRASAEGASRGDAGDVHGLAVAPSLFDAHLDWLRRECQVLPLDELLSSDVDDLPERAVALTFDDGYLDAVEVAAPALARHGLPATFFLTSRWLDEPGEYWWDALERLVLGNARIPDSLDVPLGPGTTRVATGDQASREAAHWRLHEALVHASLPDRERAMTALAGQCAGGPPSCRPVTADEARQLASRPGVTIGAHTVNHLSLPDQPPEVVRLEIEACRDALAHATGRKIELFGYPYGAVNRAVAAVARATCRWSVSCDTGHVPHSFDAARVPRIEVGRWTVDQLARVLIENLEAGSSA